MITNKIDPVKATELRVGNYLHEPSTGHDVQISAKGIEMIASGAGVLLPFLLTKEWLEKFGFEKTVDHPGRKLYEHDGTCPVWFNAKIGITYFFGSRVRVRECKFVHQLQNLYFALTGEELTISDQ